ncbi:MAG: DUF5668 domain-containing protein [Ferruginibacter sp.]
MDNNFKGKQRQEGRMIAGLILVAVGAALLMRNTGLFLFPGWLFSWPMILILIGIYSGIKHNFRNNTWIIMLSVGGFFLVDRIIPGIMLQPYFWPLLIIVIGVLFIVRPGVKMCNTDKMDDVKKNDNNMNSISWQEEGNSAFANSGETIKVDSVFSGVNRKILSKNFQGGKIAAVFGGADIDLSQADIQGEVDLKLDVVFGGVKLIVPSHWTVFNNIEGVFHGVDDKRKFDAAAAAMAPEKKLILRGSAVFAGVEVRSY